MYIRKVKKSESKSQPKCYTFKRHIWLCISVKLKNLKANHNSLTLPIVYCMVVYIRKVKKSESKSQPKTGIHYYLIGLCISVKLKNLKANHNLYRLYYTS